MAETEEKNKRRKRGDGGLTYDPKRGLYIGTVWDKWPDGRPRQRRVSSKKESVAVTKLNTLRADVLSGKAATTNKTMTVSEWLDKWLVIKKAEVRPKSYDSYELAVRLYIKPHIGDKRLSKLTAADVRAMQTAVQKGTKGIKGSTRSAQKAHQTLNMALTQAVHDEHLHRNPCVAVKFPKHAKKQRGVFETSAAVHILRTAAKRDDEDDAKRPKLASRWVAAFMTGARQAECIGMELDRIDFKNDVMDISWQLQRLSYDHGCGEPDADGKYPCGRVRVGYCPTRKFNPPPGFEYRPCHHSLFWTRPKSYAGERVVPMAPLLKESLKVHIQMDKDPNPYGLVWHHRDGRPISQEDDNEQWNMLMAAAGVDKKAGEAVLHEARNTSATMLLESGVDVKVIQQILGHASILQTREYQRVSLELSKSAVSNAFDALLPNL